MRRNIAGIRAKFEEDAMRRMIDRNTAKYEEDEFNAVARYKYAPNNGDAFGDFRPKPPRQRVKRTTSPGAARQRRWDVREKKGEEIKERNTMKRRE